jgi:ribosomal protein L40E
MNRIAVSLYLFCTASVCVVLALAQPLETQPHFAFWFIVALCVALHTATRARAHASAVVRVFDSAALAAMERDGDGRLCGVCGAWQPIRAHHCSQTGTCIVRFDHFCSIMRTPIGYANHVLFVAACFAHTLFLGWASAEVGGLVLARCFGALAATSSGWVTLYTILVLCGSQITFLIALILSAVELLGVSTNQLYVELFHRDRLWHFQGVPEAASPFDRGLWANCAEFLSRTPTRHRMPPPATLAQQRKSWLDAKVFRNSYYECC